MPTPKPVKHLTTPQAKARADYQKVPTRTPADDPGRYSKTPHEYGDVLIQPDAKGRTKLGGTLQRDLVYWIERHTYGKNIGTPQKIVRPEYAKLSLTALAKLCGSDRRTVARSLADLETRGIIAARDRHGCGATTAKMWKLTPERWKKAKYYEPKAMELESADEQEEDESDDPPVIPEAAETPEREVAPGRVSRPQAVAVSPAKGAPVVAIRLVYRSVDLPFPVAFRAAPGKNGRVQISCRATAPQRFANHSPSETPVSIANTQLSEYSAFLTPFVLRIWGKAIDQPLLNQIVESANGAPVAVYERVVMAKFTGSRKQHTTGLLVELARDASRAHQAELSEQRHRTAQQARQYPPLTVEELAELEAELAEPHAPQKPPCGKCKGSGQGKKEWINQGGVYAERATVCPKCHGSKVAE